MTQFQVYDAFLRFIRKKNIEEGHTNIIFLIIHGHKDPDWG